MKSQRFAILFSALVMIALVLAACGSVATPPQRRHRPRLRPCPLQLQRLPRPLLCLPQPRPQVVLTGQKPNR